MIHRARRCRSDRPVRHVPVHESGRDQWIIRGCWARETLHPVAERKAMSQNRETISSCDSCNRLQRDGPPCLRLEISPQIFSVNMLSTTCDNGRFAQLCSFLNVLVKCCLLWSREIFFQFPFLVDMILVLVFSGQSEAVSVQSMRKRHV